MKSKVCGIVTKFTKRYLLFGAAIFLLLTMLSCGGPRNITFNPNGGDGGQITLSVGSEDTDMPEAPVRAGYSFIGWYYDPDVWAEPFDAESVKKDAVVYARWERNRCTVSYVLNGGVTSEGKERDYSLLCYEGDTLRIPEVTNGSRLFKGWSTDNEGKNTELPETLSSDITLYAIWGQYYDSTDLVLPKIYITTKSGGSNGYTKCDVKLTASVEADKPYEFSSLAAGIRVRGNSTAGFEKLPYRLKFDIKQNMLGLGSDKDWVLLANYIDISLMRNWTTFTLALELNERYTSDSRWVHLFWNDSYEGVYLLCEQVESGTNRVDIEWEDNAVPSNPEDVGFLIEFGHPGGGDGNKTISLPNVHYKGNRYNIDGGMGEVKYPDGEECSEKMRKYIESYVGEVSEAIFSRDWETFCELCDVDSFVKNFIISEYMLSNDMGWVYFGYKEANGKFCLGPTWDFDQSSGCSEWGGPTYEGWYSGSPHYWFMTLIEMEQFRALVIEMWNEDYDYLHGIPDMIRAKAEEYAADIQCNFTRWTKMIGYSHWRSLPEMDKFKTYDQHIDYLCNWIENRMKWIENQLGIKG